MTQCKRHHYSPWLAQSSGNRLTRFCLKGDHIEYISAKSKKVKKWRTQEKKKDMKFVNVRRKVDKIDASIAEMHIREGVLDINKLVTLTTNQSLLKKKLNGLSLFPNNSKG